MGCEMFHRIIALAKLVLRKNGRCELRNRNRLSVRASISRRITLAKEGKWRELLTEATAAHGAVVSRHHSTPPDRFSRCRKALLAGSPSKAAHALLQDTPAVTATAENATRMASLHSAPSTTVTEIPPAFLSPPYKYTDAEVRRELRRLPFHTNPGPDGLRSSILKTLAYTPGGATPNTDAITALMTFINHCAAGDVPYDIRRYFAGCTLIGLPEGSSSSKLRPIAIGLILRRLISRLVMKRAGNDDALREHLTPLRLAVGTPAATEAIVHALRERVNQLASDPTQNLVIQVDTPPTPVTQLAPGNTAAPRWRTRNHPVVAIQHHRLHRIPHFLQQHNQGHPWIPLATPRPPPLPLLRPHRHHPRYAPSPPTRRPSSNLATREPISAPPTTHFSTCAQCNPAHAQSV